MPKLKRCLSTGKVGEELVRSLTQHTKGWANGGNEVNDYFLTRHYYSNGMNALRDHHSQAIHPKS